MTNELPTGWATAQLDELCSRIVDGSHNPPPAQASGHPMLSARNINFFDIQFDDFRLISEEAFQQEHARTKVAAGDVLLTIVGTIGRVAVVPKRDTPFALQRSVAVLKPRGVDSRYLAHALTSDSVQRWLQSNAKGTAQKGIYLKTLGSAELPVAPLAEQIRIVAKLEELLSDLDAGVAELKAAQRKLQQYRQSLLKAAVEGSLTAAWREAHPAPEETGADLLARILRERRARWEAQQLAKFEAQGKAPPKGWRENSAERGRPEIEGLPLLPLGWTWASLEQVAAEEKYSLAIGPFGSNLTVPDYRDEGVPLVFVRNIRSGQFGGKSTRYVATEKAQELLAHQVAAGDVLVTKMGEPPGDACVYPDDQPLAIITADCIKVRCAKGLMLPKFLEAVVNSHIGKGQVKPMTQGVAQKKVSLGRFSRLAVPVPPLQEQAAILQKLHAAEQEERCLTIALETSVQQSTAQRQNLLRAAFAGQLVPQEPADEPAAELLGRIRAERPAQGSARRPRAKPAHVANRLNSVETILVGAVE